MANIVIKKYLNKLTWSQQFWFRTQLIRASSSQARYNSLNIQMLTKSLHEHIFKQASPIQFCPKSLKLVESHLKKHGLSSKTSSSPLSEVNIKLPPLCGDDINQHFINIANDQLKDYRSFIDDIALSNLPPPPSTWQWSKGWTKYYADGSYESVAFPDAKGLVFDIECLMSEGDYPTMATAVSKSHWYSWVSDYLLEDKFRWSKRPQLKDLIPLETNPDSMLPPDGKWLPGLVIGHNVGFDRSFVKEQYFTEGTKMRFLDTMSLHIAICGQTSFQRLLHKTGGKDSTRKEIVEHETRQKQFNTMASQEWKKVSSMNNLRDVHQLHCGGDALQKTMRDVFVSGTMSDVREHFQDLMNYCALDVKATFEVFVKLWPEFLERFPHPVTLAGMLEMGSAYLPINDSWQRYLQQSDTTFDEMEKELKKLLMAQADEACSLIHNDEYKNDPWLWDLDWSTSPYRLNKTCTNSHHVKDPFLTNEADNYPDLLEYAENGNAVTEEYKKVIKSVYATAARIPKNPAFMPGYPVWYKELCPRTKDAEFYPGPSLISTQCRAVPKLLRLTWKGYPLHYDEKLGWGYLVPDTKSMSPLEEELMAQESEHKVQQGFPLKAFLNFLQQNNPQSNLTKDSDPLSDFECLSQGFDDSAMELEEKLPHLEAALGSKYSKKASNGDAGHDIGIAGVLFYKIPHKNGDNSNVGNPLARDYLLRAEDGTLSASADTQADRVLKLGKMCSYWKNNKKRITGQMFVWLNDSELSSHITCDPSYNVDGFYGAIVPRIVTAGTITRRAVEPTWLTVSNSYVDRIGSELKGMIQSPPGYVFVGADVDSQELWIAAVLGDAYFMKEHGCTALGWMTLQGNKTDKTDLHSKTAQIVNISRDHAKVMNYARIYGAGQTFAEKLLQQFNPQLSQQEAKRKASEMYKQTKGRRNAQRQWIGGSESYMFNALETVAYSEKPRTPVLGCCISKALEPSYVMEDFLTSRVNWVVQSSAVDYLHLMLVCMRWLFTTYNIKGRFCISIHDEVRYLVKTPDRYNAALALQITNLLTRCMFAFKLGMNDLPQSVAFFSAVDIDQCLRKEVTMDCVTPSNPHGLHHTYNIPRGEALDIFQILDKTEGLLQPTS
uniref:DNA polymerase subunit gamma-1 n=1 Tax=Biomphalaria glabrata TaxID=6526 RepID=A0A2C9KDE8_BIOGL